MLPFKRNKVDISVSSATYSQLDLDYIDPFVGTESAGAATFCKVWETSNTQERPDENAEGPLHCNVSLSTASSVAKERKYFDSGDYALSKAGVAPQNTVGTAIPNPEK